MPCLNGKVHDYQLENDQYVCHRCGRVSLHQPGPSYDELLRENVNLRKALENICECRGDLDEQIDRARTLLKMP